MKTAKTMFGVHHKFCFIRTVLSLISKNPLNYNRRFLTTAKKCDVYLLLSPPASTQLNACPFPAKKCDEYLKAFNVLGTKLCMESCKVTSFEGIHYICNAGYLSRKNLS